MPFEEQELLSARELARVQNGRFGWVGKRASGV
jgi:hypothetical protein